VQAPAATHCAYCALVTSVRPTRNAATPSAGWHGDVLSFWRWRRRWWCHRCIVRNGARRTAHREEEPCKHTEHHQYCERPSRCDHDVFPFWMVAIPAHCTLVYAAIQPTRSTSPLYRAGDALCGAVVHLSHVLDASAPSGARCAGTAPVWQRHHPETRDDSGHHASTVDAYGCGHTRAGCGRGIEAVDVRHHPVEPRRWLQGVCRTPSGHRHPRSAALRAAARRQQRAHGGGRPAAASGVVMPVLVMSGSASRRAHAPPRAGCRGRVDPARCCPVSAARLRRRENDARRCSPVSS